MAFVIKRGDRRPRFRVQLTQTTAGETVPVDITGVSSVKMLMKQGGGALKVNTAMTVVDATNGIVEYAWGATDTDTSGAYNVEVELDWGGEKQTFPSEGYFTVTINEDLG